MKHMIAERVSKRLANTAIPKEELLYIFDDMPGFSVYDNNDHKYQLVKTDQNIRARIIDYYTMYLQSAIVRKAGERGAQEIDTGWSWAKVKDSKAKIYNSEDSAITNMERKSDEFYLFGEISESEAKALVSEVLSSGFWKKSKKNAPLPVNARPASILLKVKTLKPNIAGSSYAIRSEIHLDKDKGMNRFVLLHELAHQAGYGNHGRGFRLAQVLLLAKFGGKGVGLRMARKLHKTYVARKLPVVLSDIPPVMSWREYTVKAVKSWVSVVGKRYGKKKGMEAAAFVAKKLKAGDFWLAADEKTRVMKFAKGEILDAPDGKIESKVNLD